MRILLYVLPIALHIYVLFDILQTKIVALMPKWAWLFVQVVPVIGPLLWLVAGKRGTKFNRPQGPDDDPDFLRNL